MKSCWNVTELKNRLAEESMTMITLAIAGAAHIHIPSFIEQLLKHPEVRVNGVWDHNETRAMKCAARVNTTAVGNLNDIWRDPAIDAILVASETNLHRDIACAAAEARKHLFVEKPLGLNKVESLDIAKSIARSGVIFNTGFGKRTLGFTRFIREHIRLGSFGKVTRVRVSCVHGGALRDKFDTEWRWMADPEKSGGGGFLDLGVHGLDLLIWWMGDVEDVTASIHAANGRYPGCDEFGEGLLKFRCGAVGTLAAGWVDVTDPIDFAVWGTEGQAYLTRDDRLFFRSNRVAGADGKTPWLDVPPSQPGPFAQFLDAVGGKKDVELIPVQEAAHVDSVMEALYRGSRLRQWQPVSRGTNTLLHE
jgi:predicted dehydrogenase